jgi:hypothetical protein
VNDTSLFSGLLATALYLAAVLIDENVLVPVGTILVIGGGIWWLGRKLQSLEDGLNHLQKTQDDLKRRVDKLPQIECKK